MKLSGDFDATTEIPFTNLQQVLMHRWRQAYTLLHGPYRALGAAWFQWRSGLATHASIMVLP